MKSSKLLAMLAFIFTTAFVMGQSAQAQAQTETQNTVTGKLTQTGTALKGTSGYETIRQFILSHPGKNFSYTGRLIDRSATPSSFQVSLTTTVHGVAEISRIQPETAPGPTPGPPVPPPSGNHAVGDTFTITSTAGGYTQEWDYTYENDASGNAPGWDLTGFSEKPSPRSPNVPIGNR